MIKPEFTPRIDLGHVMQAAILLVTATVGGGGALGLYNSIQGQINAQAVQYAALQQQVVQHAAAIRQLQDDERHVTETINASLQKLSDELVALQVSVAKSERR